MPTNSTETIQYPDGRVELKHEAFEEISRSPLFNRDLAPVKVSDRNWTTYNYAALWISMAHCIPTYMLSSGLISAGMNWWQALITILLGNTIVLIPILLNSHPGTKYGIPFPVFARAAYGTYGSNLPALMRAIVACGWFGIQAWIGGEALYIFFGAIIPRWPTLLGGWLFLGYGPTRVAFVSALLGLEYLHHLSRHGSAEKSRELGGAICAGDDLAAARMGDLESTWSRLSPDPAKQISQHPGILADLHSLFDRNDRILGDAVA